MLSRCCAVVLLVLAFLPCTSAKKPEKVYPERGTIVAMRTERVTGSTGVYTDSQGKTHGGAAYSRRIPVYRVRTTEMDYEIEGRQKLSIGEEVRFRIEKNRVYVERGDKEQKFLLVGQEKR